MDQGMELRVLAAANCTCAAVSASIVFRAFRDWPRRYAHHTLSPSVTVFFVAFVTLSILGAAATGLYAQTRRTEWRPFALAPGFVLVAGLAVGILKALTSGDF